MTNSAAPTPLIQLDSACLSHGSDPVFSNQSLVVKPGEKVLIKGDSGTGKTSFFKILLGFETLSSGNALIDGCPVTPEHIHNIRDKIFYLSQDIDFRNEQIRPMMERIFDARNKNVPTERLNRLLDFFGLHASLLEKEAGDLSGGERQRIGLLIGFALECPIWLLDEPTSALEDTMKARLADAVMEKKQTILIISHDSVWTRHPDIIIHRWT